MPSNNSYQNIPFYIYTFDKSWFILKVYLKLFQKYWGPWKKVTILGFNKPNFALPKDFKFVSLGKDEGPDNWTTPICKYFKKSKDQYFMFAIDDFLPIAPLNHKILKDLYRLMLKDKTIVKAGLGYTPSDKPEEITIIKRNKDYDIFELKQDAPYRLSIQTGIWKKSYFVSHYQQPMNPWQVEIEASERAKNDGARIIGTKRKHAFRWIERTALSKSWKGKINILGLTQQDLEPLIKQKLLDPEVLQYGQHISPPFSKYGYDFKIEDLKDYYDKDYYLALKKEYGQFYKTKKTNNPYSIPNTKNINPNPAYKDYSLEPKFQQKLSKFKRLVKKLVKEKQAKTFFKFGDGEYHFLKKNPYGTATPGYVTLVKKNYDNLDLTPFHQGVLKCDYLSCNIFPEDRQMFSQTWPDRNWDFPAEFHYGLAAGRWFTRTFKGKIGLIGAKEKLDLIKELVKHKQYRDYLGLDAKGFTDYINFPQRGSSDNIKKTEKIVGDQLKKAKSSIFLLGIGQAKMALLHRFPKYKKALYIDVGAGIDGFAGMLDDKRPYAGDWVNFRLEDYDYSKIHQTYTRYHGQGKHVFLRSKQDNLLGQLEKIKQGTISRPYAALNIYNDLLAKYKNQPANILVVATKRDKFISALKKYLPKANINYVGDQDMSKADLIKLGKKHGPIDIVIDYGKPLNNRQVNTFIALFPLLNNNGSYILENTFNSYWPTFGGKLYGQNSTIEVLKTMIDRLNWFAYRHDKAGEGKITNDKLDYFEQTLGSIHFYNNLAIIEKTATSHPKLYQDGVVKDYT